MSGISGEVRGDRSDFELPDEILSVIPTDPFDQLDLAKKITSMAIASRVSNLEVEVIELRQKLQEREIGMHELEEKACRLESCFRESDSRLKIVLHENVRNCFDLFLYDPLILFCYRFNSCAHFFKNHTLFYAKAYGLDY